MEGVDVNDNPYDHLEGLAKGDELADRLGNAEQRRGTDGVVGVHEGVHEQVHGGEVPDGGDQIAEAVPAVYQVDGVMEPMEEDQLLLAKDDEEGVDEFESLADDEGPAPEPDRALEQVSPDADRVVQSLPGDGVDQPFSRC